jgi:hypothetical protein
MVLRPDYARINIYSKILNSLHEEDLATLRDLMSQGSENIKVISMNQGSENIKVMSMSQGSENIKVISMSQGSENIKVISMSQGSENIKVISQVMHEEYVDVLEEIRNCVIIINLLFYCIAICCFIFSLLGSRHCSYI